MQIVAFYGFVLLVHIIMIAHPAHRIITVNGRRVALSLYANLYFVSHVKVYDTILISVHMFDFNYVGGYTFGFTDFSITKIMPFTFMMRFM